MTDIIINSNISELNQKHNELHDAFLQVFNGRSNYQISNFVIGPHCTIERQYDQCVTELQRKYFTIRRADVNRRKLIKEIEECKDQFLKEEKIIDLEELEIGIISSLKEFNYLYEIFKSMPKFSAEELQKAESMYWLKRLTTQAQIDVECNGSVDTGNAEALRQINLINDHSNRFMNYIKDHPGVNEIVKNIAKEIEDNK
jgi:hypothetical protein